MTQRKPNQPVISKHNKPSNRKREQSAVNHKAWLRHHRDTALDSLLRLVRQPVSSALTWLVIAISLTLPTLFYLALTSLQQQTVQWQEGGQITLYLRQTVSEADGERLTDELNARAEVLRAHYISAEEAWASFRETLNLSRSPFATENNPLPASIVVIPTQQNNQQLEVLRILIDGLPEVEEVQLDLAWIERLNRFIDLIYRIVAGLAALLGIAVLLVVGNTIRLAIESRKAEIQVVKLLGATEAFVRRPFIYLGLWYGLFGGLAAWMLVSLVIWWLSGPLAAFLSTYGLTAPIAWLSVFETLLLILAAILVAILGARIALWRHLKDAEPQ
ncbi:MAG: permease-like cell division protein FtsX [Saccharospirillum sp.]|nr:permease-like cell division protein FtsX [Saccharospirillum sp.]